MKITAVQWKIRDDIRGPTQQKIQEALMEINPIIFSEGLGRHSRESYRNFNFSCSQTISGYMYHKLSNAIYKILCLKRELTRSEIEHILTLTSRNWDQISSLIARTHIPADQEPRRTPTNINIPEFGVAEMENIRHQVESNGSNQIPREMRDYGQPMTMREATTGPGLIYRNTMMTDEAIQPLQGLPSFSAQQDYERALRLVDPDLNEIDTTIDDLVLEENEATN